MTPIGIIVSMRSLRLNGAALACFDQSGLNATCGTLRLVAHFAAISSAPFGEPENHLSYSRLHGLINAITKKAGARQLIITTHSSFVLNKLGINNVILFRNGNSMRLDELSADTYEYFKKLPGHDTLRLLLSSRSILVEGPSDELVVQKAFTAKHGASPLEKGVDVISVRGLAFKRFLEIAKLLGIKIDVVTDNDGDVAALGSADR